MRYSLYDPYVGNHRATLAADWLAADLNKAVGVGLDVNGRVVKGAGNTGVIGVLVLTKVRKSGDTVDVMAHGEITEADVVGATNTASGLVAGTVYYAAAADGALSTTNTGVKVGHTVEASRLIVNVSNG